VADRAAYHPQDAPDLNGRRVVVVGLGLTGEAVARFLIDRGARVTVSDGGPAERLSGRAGDLAERGALLELGGHQRETFASADLIVLSPGVPPTIEPLAAARRAGVPITGEIELASRFLDSPVVAVTGTNGKTTTTALIGEMCRAAGMEIFIGGNIGNPLVNFVRIGGRADAVVVEVSSYQLETVQRFKPQVGVLLNVTADHLDRYRDFDEYAAVKRRLFARQDESDLAVINRDDPEAAAVQIPGRRREFSRTVRPETGAFLDGDQFIFLVDSRPVAKFPAGELTLTGLHNRENVMAAMLAAGGLGVDLDAAFDAARRFKGLPHRLQWVAQIDGVDYYDDSKGTNVGAAVKSLESLDRPVVLIAGGRDKGGDYRPLATLIQSRVKKLILLGEAKERIRQALGGLTETVLVDDMAEAVDAAQKAARTGDAVLLSPACSSFDMFTDYGHRGQVFQELVLKESHGQGD
jgi:UDP-N-acetylmuramoylalanine--D-glutamate ligase